MTIEIFVVLVALFAGRLVLLRQWVPEAWTLAATVGVLAALAMIGLVSHGIRRKWSSGAFYWSSVPGVMVPFFYALGMRFPVGSSEVWVVLDVVACAYSAITMAALTVFLLWAVPKGIKRRRDAQEHPSSPGGAFTATDPDHRVLSGQTLEDLVDAVRQVRGRRANFTLVWERPLASVPGTTGSW